MTWIRNNWRLNKVAIRKGKVRVADVIRHTMQDAITAKFKEILGKDDIDLGSQECFRQYNRAVSQVVRDLSADKLAEVEETAREWSDKGPPAEEQRRQVGRALYL